MERRSWIEPDNGLFASWVTILFLVMVIDSDENLQIGGLFRYVDNASKKIEAEATAINKITVRIDKNGNGEFEEGESTVVSIMDDGLQTICMP